MILIGFDLNCAYIIIISISSGCKTASNKPCVPTYFYKDLPHVACIKEDHDKAWCATKTDADYNVVEWDNCGPNCMIGMVWVLVLKFGIWEISDLLLTGHKNSVKNILNFDPSQKNLAQQVFHT